MPRLTVLLERVGGPTSVILTIPARPCRLRETQLRPLHSAVRSGDLASEQVDRILGQIIRLAQQPPDDATTRPTVDGPTIARLGARAQRAATTTAPTPAWLPPLLAQLDRTEAALARALRQAPSLDPSDAVQLRAQLERTYGQIGTLLDALPNGDPATPEA